MKKQIFMSASSSGGLFGMIMSRKFLMAGALLLSMLAGVGVWGSFAVYQNGQLAMSLKHAESKLQQLRAGNDSRIKELSIQLQAEQNKRAVYARTLGQMQARMARLDALGARLVDVASLDKSEFDFGLSPAFGGLSQKTSTIPIADDSLNHGIFSVDGRLKQLDAQLAAVNFMLEKKTTAVNAKPHAWPTTGGWISSGFGWRIDPFTGAQAFHHGVDIANHFGAPVKSASLGIVTFAGKMEDFGYVVDVEHGYGYRTRYAHLSSLAVNVGDVVGSKQTLGRIGSTGHSTGPHLHYEVRRNGKLIDPRAFLPRG
ncbi:MAG: M23 family metallopeptidase [Mariprofundus sp.]|nr:M23 family metallopeptidase [Mariprofundus sp.]